MMRRWFFWIADSTTRSPRLIPRALAISVVLLCAGAGAQAEDANSELPAAPILRVETQHHDAVIRAIDADAASRFAVTAAYDKTVRVWSLSDGHPLRVLRLPTTRTTSARLMRSRFRPMAALSRSVVSPAPLIITTSSSSIALLES